LKPTPELSRPPAGTAGCCDVAAVGVVRATLECLPALRQNPGVAPGGPLPPALLKHADEQTVVGLAAVLQAVLQYPLTETSFTDWGVLAAPRFQGRLALAAALTRFAAEGAWGLSPHLIPHRSLHAISGTVSQALKIHGPNFGVGGGPGSAAEAVLAAVALLGGRDLPGVWVVMTGWNPEPVPDREGRTTTPAVCSAVALALVPSRPGWHGLRLRVAPAIVGERPVQATDDRTTPFSLESVLMALSGPELPRTSFVWSLAWGGRLELDRPGGAPTRHRQTNGCLGAMPRHVVATERQS
jgi:hypothetical protein